MGTVTIATQSDWGVLRARRLTTVVDPMVFRTADVFFRGRGDPAAGETKDPSKVWEALSANVDSFAMFVDSVLLGPQLPIFDYEFTFPVWTGDRWAGRIALLDMCNQRDELLVPISVHSSAYHEVKEAAVAEMVWAPPVPLETVRSIESELSAFDYEWRPELPGFEPSDEYSVDRLIATFRYGGLLFGGYAQILNGAHVMQPKRSALFVKSATPDQYRTDESDLFRRVDQIFEVQGTPLHESLSRTRLPTLLPYLLSYGDDVPKKVLNRLLSLRRKGEIVDLRHWVREMRKDSLRGGPKRGQIAKELAAALDVVRRRARLPGTEEMTVQIHTTGKGIEAGVSLPIRPGLAWGWFLRQLPGRRHRKVLTKILDPSYLYDVEKDLRAIWW